MVNQPAKQGLWLVLPVTLKPVTIKKKQEGAVFSRAADCVIGNSLPLCPLLKHFVLEKMMPGL